MPCTEAYREHIMYTFNGYCKTVIRFAAINAWRDRSRRRQKEISLEYLTEEKFYPLGTTDEYFEAPYEEYPITICGQHHWQRTCEVRCIRKAPDTSSLPGSGCLSPE